MTSRTPTCEFDHVTDLVEGFLLAGVAPGIDGLAETIDWYRRELVAHLDSPFIPAFAEGA